MESNESMYMLTRFSPSQVRAGMSIGHSPDEPQWSPDQRKSPGEVTEADKKEAKRRIQGSVNTDMSETSSDEAVEVLPSGPAAAADADDSSSGIITAPVVVPVIAEPGHTF